VAEKSPRKKTFAVDFDPRKCQAETAAKFAADFVPRNDSGKLQQHFGGFCPMQMTSGKIQNSIFFFYIYKQSPFILHTTFTSQFFLLTTIIISPFSLQISYKKYY
jgi:hypothetical protein